MSNIARVILEGHLTRDPESKQTKGNHALTIFAVAVNGQWQKADGNEFVSYFNIETWNKTAENCAKYLKKGSHVLVEGYLRQERWTDQEGKNRERVKVVASNVRFLSRAGQDRQAA